MDSNLTYVDTILNLAGINTEAVSIYVRMIALTNARPFWYYFSEFLQIWKCHGHACMLSSQKEGMTVLLKSLGNNRRLEGVI